MEDFSSIIDCEVDFSSTIDRAAVVNTRSHLQEIADNTKNIADNADMANHYAMSKVKYLDYNKLTDDVKVVHLHKNVSGQ